MSKTTFQAPLPALFSIESYDPKFDGYFLDASGNLWSTKSGAQRMISKARSKLNGYSVNTQYLIVNIQKTQAWKDFVQNATAKKMPKEKISIPVTKDTFVIALIDDNGVPKFSSAPKIHDGAFDALDEVKRLSMAFPGKKFAYFKCMGVAVANGLTWL